jgi:hypothetical protein
MNGLWPGRSQLHDGTLAVIELTAMACSGKESAIPRNATRLTTVEILKPPRIGALLSSVRDGM